MGTPSPLLNMVILAGKIKKIDFSTGSRLVRVLKFYMGISQHYWDFTLWEPPYPSTKHGLGKLFEGDFSDKSGTKIPLVSLEFKFLLILL